MTGRRLFGKPEEYDERAIEPDQFGIGQTAEMCVPSASSHRRVRSSSSASHCSKVSKPGGRWASSDTAHLLTDWTRLFADYAGCAV